MSSLADPVIARMVAQRDLVREMDERFSSICADVDSADESVSIQVDALGALTGLWLGPHALEREPDALATLIVDTAASAAQIVLDRQDIVVDELNQRMRAVRETPVDPLGRHHDRGPVVRNPLAGRIGPNALVEFTRRMGRDASSQDVREI